MKPFLEHLNITSTDVDETIRFLLTAMPEFSVRGEGGGEKAQRWVHVGTEESYLCVEDRGATERGPHKPYVHPGSQKGDTGSAGYSLRRPGDPGSAMGESTCPSAPGPGAAICIYIYIYPKCINKTHSH